MAYEQPFTIEEIRDGWRSDQVAPEQSAARAASAPIAEDEVDAPEVDFDSPSEADMQKIRRALGFLAPDYAREFCARQIERLDAEMREQEETDG